MERSLPYSPASAPLDEFLTSIWTKFFRLWKAGEATCRLGQRSRIERANEAIRNLNSSFEPKGRHREGQTGIRASDLRGSLVRLFGTAEAAVCARQDSNL